MNTRRGFAWCAVLVSLVAANGAAAQQQPRAGRQERRAQPKQPEPSEPVYTTLFRQTDVPYVVVHTIHEGAEICLIFMEDQPTKTSFVIDTNGSDRIVVAIGVGPDPLPAQFTRPEVRLKLSVEVEGVAQTYNVITDPPKKNGSGWAEGSLPRVALRHLQSAVNNRSGFAVKVEGGEPIRFSVPPRAAAAFHECGRSVLRSRIDGAMDRANRELEQMPSR